VWWPSRAGGGGGVPLLTHGNDLIYSYKESHSLIRSIQSLSKGTLREKLGSIKLYISDNHANLTLN